MAAKSDDAICYVGMPRMTQSGRDVLAFHLHRYVAIWLRRHGRDRVLVTVGFEKSACESTTVALSVGQSRAVAVGWNFDDLIHTCQYGDGRLRLEQGGDDGDSVSYEVTPVYDDAPEGVTSRALLAFVLILRGDKLTPEAMPELSEQVAEAVRAGRRNAVRLFFDDNKALAMKAFLYRLMSHLPEWSGCDHSASFILTSNLEAMTLEDSERARFSVLAERLFLEHERAGVERLVGMSVSLGDASSGILRAAIARQRREPQVPFHVFVRDGEDPSQWVLQGEEHQSFPGLHRVSGRDDESMYVLVPLLAQEGADTELLGFLSLAYRTNTELAASIGPTIVEMSDKLAATLRFSPLYTLRARKLWILTQTRQALARTLAAPDEGTAKVEQLIGEVSALIGRHVEIPSFAIGYIQRSAGPLQSARRHLRYVHPKGWSHFDQLELAVDVDPADRVDSGVSSLAVRLARPLVLAGGHGQGEALAFRNYLFVHEESAQLIDARSPEATMIADDASWVRLSDYYKPVRQTAYATLAYPILFGHEALGVLTIEVDKDTDWLWWTGFGGQLFWELLAAELAYAFWALGVR
ncbi:MAG: hypothetical protein H0U74_01070 [Bradymonadaceae bacterium]|nr:hypothetical protein [Lujinxingiaceae bacterium]